MQRTRKLLKTIILALPLIMLMATVATASAATEEGAGFTTLGKAIGAGLAIGLAGIGAGYAVGVAGAAAISTTAEKPEMFGRAMIFVVLGEGIAIYGLLIAILVMAL